MPCSSKVLTADGSPAKIIGEKHVKITMNDGWSTVVKILIAANFMKSCILVIYVLKVWPATKEAIAKLRNAAKNNYTSIKNSANRAPAIRSHLERTPNKLQVNGNRYAKDVNVTQAGWYVNGVSCDVRGLSKAIYELLQAVAVSDLEKLGVTPLFKHTIRLI